MAFDWFIQELDGDGKVVQNFKLHPPACTLGRSDENSLVLDRESVSSTHAKFSLDPDGDWWIEDQHSTNGIWKGDRELKGLHRLTDGELLEIGVVKVRVERRQAPSRPSRLEIPREAPPPDASGRIHVDDEGNVEDEPPDTGEPIVIETYEDEEEIEPDPEQKEDGHSPGPASGSRAGCLSPQPEPTSKPEPKPRRSNPPRTKKEKPPRTPSGDSELKRLFKDKSLPLWQRLTEAVLLLLARLHAFLARWLPVIIGFCTRRFARLPMPLRFTLGFLTLAAIAAWSGWVSLPRYTARFDFNDAQLAALGEAGYLRTLDRILWLARGVAVLCLGAAAYAWVRRGRTLFVFKAALALWILYWLYVLGFYTAAPGHLKDLDPDYVRNEVWLRSWVPWLCALPPALLVALGTALRPVRNHYRGEAAPDPLTGDRVVESLRTGGRDPRMRSSSYWATFTFFFALALPFLLHTCGWEKPYGLVKGSGEPLVEMVKVKKKQKKPEKKMIVNNWSPYIFERMKLDDIKVLAEIEEQSMDTYEVMQERTGKLGKGGGDKGGWPEGMEGATVRFIRLEYGGGDWDQDMGKGSDYNLLLRFRDITGFPIAKETESKKVARLKLFPKGRKPPFVYLTGKGGMSFSTSEINTLRWYTTQEGGMLFIDHGGGSFGRSVESLMGRIFPGQRLVDIPNDDPIFQAPFLFPSGAPPLWQHGGTRAKGIRHDGRWVVFYHPGDLGDAWKTGHSGVAPEIAEQAYRMGINVMYYAFNMYYARHYE